MFYNFHLYQVPKYFYLPHRAPNEVIILKYDELWV